MVILFSLNLARLNFDKMMTARIQRFISLILSLFILTSCYTTRVSTQSTEEDIQAFLSTLETGDEITVFTWNDESTRIKYQSHDEKIIYGILTNSKKKSKTFEISSIKNIKSINPVLTTVMLATIPLAIILGSWRTAISN
jgi:hypothetical protein